MHKEETITGIGTPLRRIGLVLIHGETSYLGGEYVKNVKVGNWVMERAQDFRGINGFPIVMP